MGENRLTAFTIFQQPRDSCYVAIEGLPQLVYSGYQPHAYSWDEFPPLKDILDAVSMLFFTSQVLVPGH